MKTLERGIFTLGSIVILIFLIFVLFAIVGMQMYMGTFSRRCVWYVLRNARSSMLLACTARCECRSSCHDMQLHACVAGNRIFRTHPMVSTPLMKWTERRAGRILSRSSNQSSGALSMMGSNSACTATAVRCSSALRSARLTRVSPTSTRSPELCSLYSRPSPRTSSRG